MKKMVCPKCGYTKKIRHTVKWASHQCNPRIKTVYLMVEAQN